MAHLSNRRMSLHTIPAERLECSPDTFRQDSMLLTFIVSESVEFRQLETRNLLQPHLQTPQLLDTTILAI